MSAVFARWSELLTTATPVAVLGTLVCCALPIALVAFGAGSVVASLVSTAPWLIALTESKEWVFLISGFLLVANYWVLYRSRSLACQPGGVCHTSHAFGRWIRRTFWGSAGLYAVAFAAAHLLLPVAKVFGY